MSTIPRQDQTESSGECRWLRANAISDGAKKKEQTHTLTFDFPEGLNRTTEKKYIGREGVRKMPLVSVRC